MAHWQHRSEQKWQQFSFQQPYAEGLKRLREKVLDKTDFDPATLWQWGTMQGMALIGILKECEARFGEQGQKVVCDVLRKTGLDVGRQILAGASWPAELEEAEFVSFYATVINRIAYASLEKPRIESPDRVSFDILWCPHQDHYRAFDCRVQRYFVQGMIDAVRQFAIEHGRSAEFEVRFDTTIPAGAETCHFTVWRGSEREREQWAATTRMIEKKALERATRK